MAAARFTADEADGLRRAMATFRHIGTIGSFEEKMVERHDGRGYPRSSPTRCFEQIEGFANTAFRRAMRRASRCWSMSRPG